MYVDVTQKDQQMYDTNFYVVQAVLSRPYLARITTWTTLMERKVLRRNGLTPLVLRKTVRVVREWKVDVMINLTRPTKGYPKKTSLAFPKKKDCHVVEVGYMPDLNSVFA